MKDLFKTIIHDFQQTLPVKAVQPRELNVPVDSGKIVSLIGPRRSGKTYFFYQLINRLLQRISPEKIVYINFEDERLDIRKENLQFIIDAYFELYPEISSADIFFFFDEIQEIEGWEKFVRRIYDTVSKNIFITGSSAKMLGKEIATHLRGRPLVYQLFPLSFKEFCQFNGVDISDIHSTRGKARLRKNFQHYLSVGGFPEIPFLQPELISKTLQSYFDVMMFRDIIERQQVRNIPVLKYFIKRLFNTIGAEFSISKIFNELKSLGFHVSKDKLYRFLEYVTDSLMFFIHLPYEASVTKSQMTNKKIYAIDVGLANAVTFRYSSDYGKLLENVVFLHFARQDRETYFLRNSFECDFVVDQPGERSAVQVAYSLSEPITRQREVNSLLKAMHRLNLSQGLIITADEKETLKIADKQIDILPAWEWLLT